MTCECDILIPAALSDQLNGANAKDVRAKLILELANAPTTREADDVSFDNYWEEGSQPARFQGWRGENE